MNKQTWDILTQILEYQPELRTEKLRELCKGSEVLFDELTVLISKNESIDEWWSANAEYNDETSIYCIKGVGVTISRQR
ncbi:MAG: hypothetical protein BalsKO_29570 [Balneolaceae bacterium]